MSLGPSSKNRCGHCFHKVPTPESMDPPPARGASAALCCLCGVTSVATETRLAKDRGWHNETFKKRTEQA